MRVMAIDYGDARTGIAVSDLTRSIVGDTFVISDWNAESLTEKIAEEIKYRNVDTIILGYPKNMDGSAGIRCEKSEALAIMLAERTGINPILWDERRTTVDAHRILSENNYHGKKRKSTVDAVAAALILEGYLSSL